MGFFDNIEQNFRSMKDVVEGENESNNKVFYNYFGSQDNWSDTTSFYPKRFIREQDAMFLDLPFNTPKRDPITGEIPGFDHYEAKSNVYMDALWHYMGSREAAENHGTFLADLAGRWHEWGQSRMYPEQTHADNINNGIGVQHSNASGVPSLNELVMLIESGDDASMKQLIDFVDNHLHIADIPKYHEEMARSDRPYGK